MSRTDPAPRPTARVRADVGPAGAIRLSLDIAGQAWEASYASPAGLLVPNGEALIAAALLPCMARDVDLDVACQVSKKSLERLGVLQEIYSAWHPHMRPITIRGTTPVSRARSGPGRVGLFFSAGVDSFYSLFKHEGEITDLIFIHGFNRPLGDRRVDGRTAQVVHKVAHRLGLGVLEVETDVRGLLAAHGLPWLTLGHGSALASVGHLLYPQFQRLYIAATHTYAYLAPMGTHPLLDPEWSTEGLEFVHDGSEASRLAKVGKLAESELALGSLRVCSKGPDEKPNCGRCEKCLRTMLELLAVGGLERATTFEAPLDAGRVARTRMDTEGKIRWAQESLQALVATGRSTQMARALRTSIRRSRRRIWMKGLADAAPAQLRRGLRSVLRLGRTPQIATQVG